MLPGTNRAASAASTASAPPTRLPLIDAARGFAILQMIVYHFIYDLDYLGFARVRMLIDQPWLAWRAAIVTQFVLLAGVSLALRAEFKPAWRDFWRRWLQIAAAALLVSVGTWLMFGPTFVWFGILHFVAAALIPARLATPLGAWNIALGLGAAALGLAWSSDFFNAAPLNALGFVTQKPYNVDYVPLFPWIGAMLTGAGLGTAWLRRRSTSSASSAASTAAPRAQPAPKPGAAALRGLAWLGRRPLTIYLLHQPVMLSILLAGLAIARALAGPAS
jgi:uncharacterized membrane protein